MPSVAVVGLCSACRAASRASKPAWFSKGRTSKRPVKPNLKLLREEAALPVSLVGPVECCELAWLAAIWAAVDIGWLRKWNWPGDPNGISRAWTDGNMGDRR